MLWFRTNVAAIKKKRMGKRSNVTPRIWLVRKTVAPLKEIQSKNKKKEKKKVGRKGVIRLKMTFIEHLFLGKPFRYTILFNLRNNR